MTNTARIGAEVERKVRDDLLARAYLVSRSAASRGIWDLIAVGFEVVLFVQVKRTQAQIPPVARRALVKAADRLGVWGLPIVATRPPRSKAVNYRLLTGDGSKDWAPFEPQDFATFIEIDTTARHTDDDARRSGNYPSTVDCE